MPGQYQPQPGANPYPPQGGAPYAPQGGAPYPPQGGPPYPPQGGAPYQPHPGGFGAPPKSGPPRWLIPVIAGVVLVVGALSLFAFLGGSTSEVGDCVGQRGVDEVEQVDCDDDSAVGEVIGFEDGEVTYEEYLADPASCEEFPDAIGAFWEGEEGEEGRVVCVGAR